DALPQRLRIATRLSWLAGVVVACIGLALFAGWGLYVRVVTAFFPELTPMRPRTALCFALSGTALLLCLSGARLRALALAGRFGGLLVAALGFVTLVESVTGMDLAVDAALRAVDAGIPSSRMSPNTAFAFVLTGLGLFLLDSRTRRDHRPGQVLALLAAVIAAQALIGYLFGTRWLHSAMSISTAALLILIGVGVTLARPHSGMAGTFLRETSGGFTIRRLLPSGAAVTVTLGFLLLLGFRGGLYGIESGLAALVILVVAVFGALIWFNAWKLDEMEATARHAEREREQLLGRERSARETAEAAERRFRDLVQGLSEIVWEGDPQSLRFSFVSERAEKLLGHPVRRWLEEPVFWIGTVVPPEDRERVRALSRPSANETFDRVLEYRAVAADGRVLWLRDTARVLPPTAARAPSVRGMIVDVTEAKQAERRVATQHAATRVLSEAPTLLEAAPAILEVICECLDWQVGALWTPTRAGTTLRCIEMWTSVPVPGFKAESVRREFAAGVGLPGRVWTSGAPAWIRDVVEDTNFPRAPFAAREGLHGAVGFPIRLSGETLGVMEFFSPEIRSPDPDMLRMMAAIGNQIGQFIER
ncbi:MAG: GAF domain-containing protein, partial [Candidatus Binatia bacterium]